MGVANWVVEDERIKMNSKITPAMAFAMAGVVVASCLVAILLPPSETPVNVTERAEEQVSIQEEEMEIIHTQEISLWCEMVVVHDNPRNVTCWCYQGGLVCIPDHMLTP